MPTPFEILPDPVSLTVLGLHAALIARQHTRGVHSDNHADLPIHDAVRHLQKSTRVRRRDRFYHDVSARGSDMLCFQDVLRPQSGCPFAPAMHPSGYLND